MPTAAIIRRPIIISLSKEVSKSKNGENISYLPFLSNIFLSILMFFIFVFPVLMILSFVFLILKSFQSFSKRFSKPLDIAQYVRLYETRRLMSIMSSVLTKYSSTFILSILLICSFCKAPNFLLFLLLFCVPDFLIFFNTS